MRRRLSGRVAAAAEEGSLQLRQGDASDEWVWGVALRHRLLGHGGVGGGGEQLLDGAAFRDGPRWLRRGGVTRRVLAAEADRLLRRRVYGLHRLLSFGFGRGGGVRRSAAQLGVVEARQEVLPLRVDGDNHTLHASGEDRDGRRRVPELLALRAERGAGAAVHLLLAREHEEAVDHRRERWGARRSGDA